MPWIPLGRVTALQPHQVNVLWNTNISPEDQNDSIIGGGLAYGAGKIFVTHLMLKSWLLTQKQGISSGAIQHKVLSRAAPTYVRWTCLCLDDQ